LEHTPRSPILFFFCPNAAKSSKPSTRFDERVVASGHHTERAIRKIRGGDALVAFRWFWRRGVAVTPLPEIAPDGIEQNAQPSRRTAAVKKIRPPFLNAPSTVSAICRARPDSANSRYFAHHVIVRFRTAISIRRQRRLSPPRSDPPSRMRRFGHERAEFELAGNG